MSATTRIFLALSMRTVLFFLSGLLMIGIFVGFGYENAMNEAVKWWPFQAIFANIVTYFILNFLLRKEGLSYNSILHFKKEKLPKDLAKGLLYLVISFPVAAIGLYGFSYLLLGSWQPPTHMMQALPLWAAVLAIVLFPISNALVEIPTYMGYAFPRIEKKWGSVGIAILLTALFLAIQHGPLPIVLGGAYISWRVIAFFPLALVLGFIYHKTRNITPLLFAHYVMDLQMVVYVLLASLGFKVV